MTLCHYITLKEKDNGKEGFLPNILYNEFETEVLTTKNQGGTLIIESLHSLWVLATLACFRHRNE